METLQPKLRFPEFGGDWRKDTLNNLTIRIGDGLHGTPNYIEYSDVFFINGNNLSNGKIVITENTKKVDGKTYIDNDKQLDDNSLLISINGTIGNVAKYNNEKVMLGKSVGYLSFRNNRDFYFQLFQNNKIQDYFTSELTGSTIKNLSLKTIRETEVLFPNNEEQTKIANFLSSIDEKINLLKEKKALLEEYKKGMMQKIFNQEIRFKDNNGNDFEDWEEKIFKEVFTFRNTNSLSRDKLNYSEGVVKNIHYGDIHTKFKTLFDLKEENVPFINDDVSIEKIPLDNYLKIGDLVVADASEDYDDIGKSIEIINLNNERVLAGLHTFVARPSEDVLASGFIGYLMKSDNVKIQIKIMAQGTKVLSLSPTRFAEIKFSLPCLKEQTKIANFLSAIDKKMGLVATQIEDTQEYKKGLLQQMFV